MVDTWPYDADRDDELTQHRIAVTSSHPRYGYILAFDRDSSARPTDTETAILASYIAFHRQHWYTSSWQARLLQEPLDVDEDCNTLVVHKYGPDRWGYRRGNSARRHFVPQPGAALQFTLVQVLDTTPPSSYAKWEQWKRIHPEVFPQ